VRRIIRECRRATQASKTFMSKKAKIFQVCHRPSARREQISVSQCVMDRAASAPSEEERNTILIAARPTRERRGCQCLRQESKHNNKPIPSGTGVRPEISTCPGLQRYESHSQRLDWTLDTSVPGRCKLLSCPDCCLGQGYVGRRGQPQTFRHSRVDDLFA